jgi:hypothetical protein
MSYTEQILTLRENQPFEVFKAIRFRNTTFPDRFTGHLIYSRDYYDGYNLVEGDVLDERILRTIKERFDNSFMVYSQLLFTDQQLINCLTWTKGGEEKCIMFIFFPETDYKTYVDLSSKGQLKQYSLSLRATLEFDKNDPKLNFVPNEVIVHVPLSDLENLIKTINQK